MEHEFGHMVYHEWQRRLLVASSCCFLLVAGVAHLSFAKTELACVMSVVGAASLNYWRAPGPSWRRPIDLGCAAFGMSYNSVHGWFVVQNSWANAIGWTAHTLGPMNSVAYALLQNAHKLERTTLLYPRYLMLPLLVEDLAGR